VSLRERDGFGNPIPLDALCLCHAYPVGDGGERLVRGAALLPCTSRKGRGLTVSEHLEQNAMNAADLLGHHHHGLCCEGGESDVSPGG
jgi:hypothetical protein